ncbi:hypothetical protein [Microbispora bryophytorum]|uniref:Uncharacterized protein n=1 Tax=Microbispora bryophytorum subsp. camponoti TaxID=1677852 RepID=A0ABR8L0I8_9ACTN|nr:hypothetical protein [Microbispora camponoti]MBD3141998.1 hypothetical protein [Microbispora camponoti]
MDDGCNQVNPSAAPHDLRPVTVLDSITELQRADRHKVAVTGSHGGLASGRHALAHGVAAVIFNDAGVGLNGAGTRSLADLDRWGVPAAVVSHLSARIGDGRDTMRSGVVSACNGTAQALGVRPGHSCLAAVAALRTSAAHAQETDTAGFASASRQVGPHHVVILDSASLIGPDAAGSVAVTGSHGGLPGRRAARALKHPARFAAFNDAGVGKDQAGIARLEVLDSHGVPAVTVRHDSAEIGDGSSTLRSGVVSYANSLAIRSGARAGASLIEVIRRLPE